MARVLRNTESRKVLTSSLRIGKRDIEVDWPMSKLIYMIKPRTAVMVLKGANKLQCMHGHWICPVCAGLTEEGPVESNIAFPRSFRMPKRTGADVSIWEHFIPLHNMPLSSSSQ